MISFIIFFFVSMFFLRTLGVLIFNQFLNKGDGRLKNHFFQKILNEMLENMKNQKNFFHENSQGQSYKSSYNSNASNQSQSKVDISRKEALEILGIQNLSATDEEIKARYRALIKKFHPDAGGNEYFSRKLTDARDLLLKK